MDTTAKARLNVIISMVIYGTIGLFVRYIPLPSSVTSMVRGIIGAPFLLFVLAVKKQKLDMQAIRRNLIYLLISGALLGFNWILLFEAYRFTTVATATLGYYFAPIIIVALSPILFREKLTVRKVLCILAALAGMVFVSGVASSGIPPVSELKGILLALGAACFYAAIVIVNKQLKDISAYDKTIFQLALSAVILIPYNLFTGSFTGLSMTGIAWVMLLTLGIVHTGIAYLLYFGSMDALPSQTLAIVSYIDPVVAVLVSALILRENVGLGEFVGAALILGAAVISELPVRGKEE
ncbi:MAG: EamA family transporter [Eubacteriales bacterium]|nr:EamA family transporter [Eubacteriales bacterium]